LVNYWFDNLRAHSEPRDFGTGWRGAHVFSGIIASLLGLVLTASAWRAESLRADRVAALELETQASSHALTLQDGINEYMDELDAMQALFQSDSEVNRREFNAFSEIVRRDKPATLAVSWIPRVTREQRVAHERAAAREGLAGYRIKSVAADGGLVSAPDKSEYFPVLYSSKEPLGSSAYGLDLNDGGLGQQTLDRARDEGAVATSPNFLLHSGGGDQNGFFIVLPVYGIGLPHQTLEERRKNLVGFVQAVIQSSVMIETILHNAVVPIGLDLYFFGAKWNLTDTAIHFHPSRVRQIAVGPEPYDTLAAKPHWSRDLHVGDARWTLIAIPISGGPGTANRSGSWIILLSGLLVTAAAVAYIWASGRKAQQLKTANRELDRTVGALYAAHEQLSAQNVHFDAALRNMLQALLMFDASGRLIICNQRYYEMYDISPEVIKPGCTIRDLLEYRQRVGTLCGDPETYIQDLESMIAKGGTFDRIFELPDGRTIAVLNHPIAGGGWVATHEDISERRHAEAKISYMARHDALTDLPNRVLFHEQLSAAIAHLKNHEALAVLCLDIDRFKGVNDTLGHPIGDHLLRATAERLRQCLHEDDIIARLGGDEFVIVQCGASQPNGATALANRMIDAVGAPSELDGHQIVVGLSIGIAIAPNDGTDPHQLLKNADMALYRAKADGRGICRFFEPGMDARMQARRVLELDLRKALTNGEFELFYQPLVHIESESISGFEALLRWRHPQRGMIPPLDFIPVAEDTGLIVPIGDWALRQACMQTVHWPAEVKVAVNLSPRQFKSKDLLATVLTALSTSRLSPNRLELEITESSLLQDSEGTLAVLNELRCLGVRISMDDFGTGYSSLSYLRKFPFDKFKIDGSFIRDISERGDSLAIVRAVIAMSAGLGMVTTAEGVETVEQLTCLRREGCTEAQGFLFSRPRPAAEIGALLASFNFTLNASA
jgi:diguanylate cyclase (GGDEF)-like protein